MSVSIFRQRSMRGAAPHLTLAPVPERLFSHINVWRSRTRGTGRDGCAQPRNCNTRNSVSWQNILSYSRRPAGAEAPRLRKVGKVSGTGATNTTGPESSNLGYLLWYPTSRDPSSSIRSGLLLHFGTVRVSSTRLRLSPYTERQDEWSIGIQTVLLLPSSPALTFVLATNMPLTSLPRARSLASLILLPRVPPPF